MSNCESQQRLVRKFSSRQNSLQIEYSVMQHSWGSMFITGLKTAQLYIKLSDANSKIYNSNYFDFTFKATYLISQIFRGGSS